MDSNVNTMMLSTVSALCVQLSPALHERVLKIVFDFATSHLLLHFGKLFGWICSYVTRANTTTSLARFIPYLTNTIVGLCSSHAVLGDSDADESEVDAALEWNLHLIARIVEYTGLELVKYQSHIHTILSKVLPIASLNARNLGCKLLRHVLFSLTETYMIEGSPFTKTQNQLSPRKLFAFRYYYAIFFSLLFYSYDLRGSSLGAHGNLEIEWHVPSNDEIAFAQSLLNDFYYPTLSSLSGFVDEGLC
jgi:proteasome activator subunit 4